MHPSKSPAVEQNSTAGLSYFGKSSLWRKYVTAKRSAQPPADKFLAINSLSSCSSCSMVGKYDVFSNK